MTQMQEYVVRERFDNVHNGFTLDELRWMLLRGTQRYSAMYVMLLLGTTTGMRCDELLNLTLNHIRGDFKNIIYCVDKPRVRKIGSTIILDRKHRNVELDPWVAGELKAYCDLHFGKVLTPQGLVYYSPFHDKKPDRRGMVKTNKLFDWRDTISFEAAFWKMRKKMLQAGFDAERMETLSTWHVRHHKHPTYVIRFHGTRKLFASIMYYKLNKDLKAVQKLIKHSRSQTTDGYVKTAKDLGTTEEYLKNASWAEICGLGNSMQLSLSNAEAPDQMKLDQF